MIIKREHVVFIVLIRKNQIIVFFCHAHVDTVKFLIQLNKISKCTINRKIDADFVTPNMFNVYLLMNRDKIKKE